MTVALWPSLRSLGFRWRLTGGWNHPAVRRLIKLSAWVIVYVVANQIAFLVVNLLAGGIGEARFQIYATAFIIFSLPHAIFGVSIFTALLPGMASQWTEGNRHGVVTLLSRGIRDTTVVIVPAALAYLAIATPIVALLLQYGEANPARHGADRPDAAGLRRRACPSSRSSSCSRAPSTRCRTAAPPR